MFRLSPGRKAFTLVELLVVLLVVGVLLAIALPAFLHAQDSAKDAKAKTALSSSYKAAKVIAARNGGAFTGGAGPADLHALAEEIAQSNPGTPVSAGSGHEVGTVYITTPEAPNNGDGDLHLETPSDSGKTCSLLVHDGAITSLGCVQTFSLTVSATGAGSTNPSGTSTKAEGEVVTITATPANGKVISAWGGACEQTAETEDSCTLTMDANKNVSVTFEDPPVVTDLSAGRRYVCALYSNGSVKCWGRNNESQLGDGIADHGWRANCAGGEDCSPTPVSVIDTDNKRVKGASSVRASFTEPYVHSCALFAGGTIKCWGQNTKGQMGISVSGGKAVLVRDESNNAVSGASHLTLGFERTCALFSGAPKCWGYNYNGSLGSGTTGNVSSPGAVKDSNNEPLDGASDLSANGNFSCAIFAEGVLKCWGTNWGGQLGNGTNTDSSTAVVVTDTSDNPVSGATAVSAGGYGYVCAIFSGGTVKCWGNNSYGQLGNGTHSSSSHPVAVKDASGTPVSGATALATGYHHVCALFAAGAIKCWGRNLSGALGDGTTTTRDNPVAVQDGSGNPVSGALAISAAEHHSCALFAGGAVKCWGANSSGQLGDGSNDDRYHPVGVSGL